MPQTGRARRLAWGSARRPLAGGAPTTARCPPRPTSPSPLTQSALEPTPPCPNHPRPERDRGGGPSARHGAHAGPTFQASTGLAVLKTFEEMGLRASMAKGWGGWAGRAGWHAPLDGPRSRPSARPPSHPTPPSRLQEDLLRGIYAFGFEKPSAIQARAVGPILRGRDVVAQAQSGTGKTSMIALTACQLVDPRSAE